MTFILLGLGTGALYAICAQGLVLVYRASGIVNFAQGAFVMVGGYAFYELHATHGVPAPLAVVGAVAVGGLLGLVVDLAIMRPLRTTSPVIRLVATLGISVTLQSAAILHYGHDLRSVSGVFSARPVEIFGAFVGLDKILILITSLVLTIVLWVVYRSTSFGRVTTTVAQSEQLAASLGYSPQRIASVNWMLGSALAALAGALVAPIVFLEPNQLVRLVIPALAAALLGSFASFPLAFVGALVIGVGESVLTRQAASHAWLTGADQALPFLIVVAVLVVRGKGIPLRSHIFERLPALGAGRIRPVPVLALVAVTVVVMLLLAEQWQVALTVSLANALLCLSVVVVTGYAGQVSLAQLVLGGTASLVAAKVMSEAGVPLVPAFLLGIVAALLLGVLIGGPALRTRGVSLAIVTLATAAGLFGLLLDNNRVNTSSDGGPSGGIPLPDLTFFGLDIDPERHAGRYGLLALAALVLAAIAVSNLRRSAAGRRLLAVRANERSAAALGVNVYVAKLFAFMVAAVLATVGTSIIAFLNPSALFNRFDVLSSVSVVTAAVVGGVGSVGGALMGSTLIAGGITSRLLDEIDGLSGWLPLVGGVLVILVLRFTPDGLFETHRVMLAKLVPALRAPSGGDSGGDYGIAQHAGAPSEPRHPRVEPQSLVVTDLTVRFGSVAAVAHVSLAVKPGTVHALIGPNGAGKTTFIDAVTGFVTPETGTVTVGETTLDGWRPARRTHVGLARSFQSAELLDDLTVGENLAAGSDDNRWQGYLSGLVRAGSPRLSDAALAVVDHFGLRTVLDELPGALPFGHRRLLSVAQAMAGAPSVLLLDEPAAGLDDDETQSLGTLIRSLATDWGVSVLLVEHHLDLVLAISDEVTVLDGGEPILTAASPGEVRRDPRVMEAYVGGHSIHETTPGRTP